MINYAINGYACFLSCQSLRKTLIKSIQMIYTNLQKKPQVKRNPSILYTVEPSNVCSRRI
jgi:hypothetical protein